MTCPPFIIALQALTDGGTIFTIVYDVKVGGLLTPLSPIIVIAMRKALRPALQNLKALLEKQD